MSDELTHKRSLESLKKEAKRWLHALRDRVPEARARLERAVPGAPTTPSLRDVQHALAVEHGFSGWTALKEHVESAANRPVALDRYEDMVNALLDAYRTGTPQAMERHWSLTWHRRAWQAMRAYVQLDIGRQVGSVNLNDDITADDARYLVAREHGFENWNALVADVAARPASAGVMLTRPVRSFSTDAKGGEHSRESSRDWNAVLSRLADPRVTGLSADGQMTDAMLEQVSRIEHITSLKLGASSNLTSAGIRHLSRLPHLRHLDLQGSAIADKDLEVMRSLPELDTLTLSWTPVTDAGMTHLSHCERLRELSLNGTNTGDGALAALAGHENIRTLRTGNGVTDSGIALLHQIPVFRQWRDGAIVTELLSPDAAPNHLMLRGVFTDRGLEHLKGLDGLFGLNLDAAELNVTAAGLAPIVTLPNLGWFSFDATDEAMPYIAAMPRLRYLGCQDTVAGDDGFVALSSSQSIEQIWGRRCHNLRTRGFLALGAMPALRGLSVSCKNVGDEGIAALPSFPALRELMPMDIPDEGYRHIGACTELEALILMYCRDTSDAATEHIVSLSRLTRYFASYNKITDRTPELLSGMSSLERITFDGCAGLTNAGIAALAGLPRLRELRISGAHISADVAKAFPPDVRVHYSL